MCVDKSPIRDHFRAKLLIRGFRLQRVGVAAPFRSFPDHILALMEINCAPLHICGRELKNERIYVYRDCN